MIKKYPKNIQKLHDDIEKLSGKLHKAGCPYLIISLLGQGDFKAELWKNIDGMTFNFTDRKTGKIKTERAWKVFLDVFKSFEKKDPDYIPKHVVGGKEIPVHAADKPKKRARKKVPCDDSGIPDFEPGD